MNIYTTIIAEFLLLSSCILILFKLRHKLGLAPLYILLGSIQFLQANLGSSVSIELFDNYEIHPGSIILFSGLLFAALLIYIKEGAASARILILGIVLSNIIMSMMFEITYFQQISESLINNTSLDPNSVFNIDFKFVFSGTLILFIDFLLLAILYQFLISKFKKASYFLVLFMSLWSILIFDAIVFNFALFYGTSLLKTSLISHLLGKSIAALAYTTLLYLYLRFWDNESAKSTFIASQERDVFSIFKYKEKIKNLQIEKKEVEEKLTSQLETTLNNISDGFVSLDTNWCYTYVNEKAGEILGKSPNKLIGKHIWTEFPEGVGMPFYKAYYKAVETQQTQYLEEYYEPFDRWFENKIYPSSEGLAIYFTDITEKRKGELALKESENHIRTILETEPECIKQLNINNELIYMNPAGLALIEADNLETVKGLPVLNLINEEYKKAFAKVTSEAFKGNSSQLVFKLTGMKGTTRWLETHGVPLKDADGNIISLLAITRDITNGKKVEEELVKNEQLYRSLTSNAPVAIFQTNEEGSCNYVNDEWIKYSGLSFEEGMGYGWSSAIHPEDKERVLIEWQQAIKNNTEFLTELRFQHKNKNITWLSAKAVGLYDEENKLYGFIGMASDITEQKTAEKLLIESRKYLDNIINNIGDPVFVKDSESHFLIANDAFYKLFNRSKEEIIGNTFAEDVPVEERERYLEIDKQVISEGIESVHEDSFSLNGGETRFISTKKTRFIDDNGNKFLIGVVRDVTERKKAELILEKNEKAFSEAQKIAKVGSYNYDFKTNIANGSATYREIIGVDLDTVITFDIWRTITHPEDTPNNQKVIEYCIETGEKFDLEYRIITKDKKEIKWIHGLGEIIYDNGDPANFFGTIQDITERKKAEIELEKHKNNLEELIESRTSELEKEKLKAQSADLMKSAFLATMSHELRTPMNSIIGFTGILLKELAGPLNDEQKKQIDMVKNSGEHLLGLINDVLDISKIEAGKLKVSFYSFNYLTCLEKTIDFLLPQATKKRLSISTEISILDITLVSDERRIEQILLNLLSNAIKFSNKGAILIKVDVKDEILITQVIDEGIGISKENILKLFKPFVQIEGGLNRSHEGTGLGLAICKSLIDKLGGTIHVSSQLGEGSNFTFKLPLDNTKKILK